MLETSGILYYWAVHRFLLYPKTSTPRKQAMTEAKVIMQIAQ